MTSICLRLEDPLAKQLNRFCKQNGYSKNGLIQTLVRQFIEQNRYGAGHKKSLQHPLTQLVGVVKLGGNSLDDEDAWTS